MNKHNALIEAYREAIENKLDPNFIKMIEQELKRRLASQNEKNLQIKKLY